MVLLGRWIGQGPCVLDEKVGLSAYRSATPQAPALILHPDDRPPPCAPPSLLTGAVDWAVENQGGARLRHSHRLWPVILPGGGGAETLDMETCGLGEAAGGGSSQVGGLRAGQGRAVRGRVRQWQWEGEKVGHVMEVEA